MTRAEYDRLKEKVRALVSDHAFFLDDEEVDGTMFSVLTARELRELYFILDDGYPPRVEQAGAEQVSRSENEAKGDAGERSRN